MKNKYIFIIYIITIILAITSGIITRDWLFSMCEDTVDYCVARELPWWCECGDIK